MTDGPSLYQHEMRVWEKEIDRYIQERLEVFKSVTDFATLAIKSIILVNGAAVIALLAFLGNIWGRDAHAHEVISAVGQSLEMFVYGVAAGVSASALAYLSQVLYTEIDSKGRNWIADGVRFSAVLAGLVGIILFALGADSGHRAFTERGGATADRAVSSTTGSTGTLGRLSEGPS